MPPDDSGNDFIKGGLGGSMPPFEVGSALTADRLRDWILFVSFCYICIMVCIAAYLPMLRCVDSFSVQS